ncbi:MAG: hypothetical protein EBZ94_02425 [Crocinitomicaceae bacterium]|nr:hypothetical protein [Crocinitomicaceae bacterium]
MAKDQPEENSNDEESENLAERPLECGECKKDISVLYTEIIGKEITRTCMCKDCPDLQRRLHGAPLNHLYSSDFENTTTLACGNCGTTFNALHVGASLGCGACYEVFSKVLLGELLSAKKISC